ncbi:FlhB-like protein [Robbsia andropogonis]
MTDPKATPWTADGGSEPRAVKRPTEAIDTDYQVRSETTRLGRPAPLQSSPTGPAEYGPAGLPSDTDAPAYVAAADGPDPRRSAVALSYDRGGTGAPRVVAKGYGLIADTIIARARAEGLYVHQAPEMVSMLMNVALDREIPPALYQAIAELLSWLYRLESASGGDIKAAPGHRGQTFTPAAR